MQVWKPLSIAISMLIKCYHRFAAAYIALQQAVHLHAALRIYALSLLKHVLRIGKFERQFMVIKLIEVIAYRSKNITLKLLMRG
jgi:hypothetical protein